MGALSRQIPALFKTTHYYFSDDECGRAGGIHQRNRKGERGGSREEEAKEIIENL